MVWLSRSLRAEGKTSCKQEGPGSGKRSDCSCRWGRGCRGIRRLRGLLGIKLTRDLGLSWPRH